MAEYSPMMQKYLETKKEYEDCVLFYRLGDFYEMFFDDAINVSRELELTLTGKDCGQEERAPMCGIPYHAADSYINRLVEKGYKVAICEQVEDPKTAKGLVKREVIKVVTPGTNFNPMALDETKNNYIMCVAYMPDSIGLATSDITTGEFLITEVSSERELIDEINKFTPSEILFNEAFTISGINISDLKDRLSFAESVLEPWYFDDKNDEDIILRHFNVATLDGLGISDYKTAVVAAGALLNYLYETQKNSLPHLTRITPYATGRYMIIDSSTRRNLELVETMREKQKKGSLLWVLDKTKTAMGARLLRNMIEQPLLIKDDIVARQKAVTEFINNYVDCAELREYLNPVYDLERLVGRISTKSASPRDLIAFKGSIAMLPPIKKLLASFKSSLIKSIYEELDVLEDICSLIEASIVDEPPIAIKDGGLIKEGYNEEIDRLRHAKTDGKQWLLNLEASEKERTGIKNLKIKYNKVFGYYFEVTNSFKNMVPDDYIRKQTLTNAERFTTPKLKELEEVILSAEDKLFSLEYDLFTEVRDRIAGEVLRIQTTAKAVAKADVFSNLAIVAMQNNYVCPTINEKGLIEIEGGRHPVVEKMISNGLFVENDTILDNHKNRISIITGPNMAGKSTYMRQTALIVLMAQIGSYIPATKANIGIVDRIFTRVGASDDLASGQSTFMVEMMEVATILKEATKNSLVILDEIGRGTSTYDGLSIAWAVAEFIADKEKCGAKTLFATHYHELTTLEETIEGIKNYSIAVKEKGENIIFLRKIVSGGTDESYGIHVARLAGVPKVVTTKANEILRGLERKNIITGKKEEKKDKKQVEGQFDMFNYKLAEIAHEIDKINLNELTPIDALNTLVKIKEKMK